jgi:molybdopterin converting factor small subunit
MIKVLFFGPVAERAGCRSLAVEHRAGLRLQQLRDELAAQYPPAFALVCFVAVDGVQVHDLAQPLDDGSEVAFMAKFSGG